MHSLHRLLGRAFAVLAIAAVVLLWSCPSRACGGFFCSTTPVDQTAERIIFTVNGDSTITAYVQISYVGQRDAFAWVVPVPTVPDVSTFPRAAFQALDIVTQPIFYPPPGCAVPILINGGGSVSISQSDVAVYRQQAVGPYETSVIGGTNTSSLVDWLRTNGYRITDQMVPFIEPYVQQHMLFLAMRLLPDKDVSDIEPVKMTYMGTDPMVPLQLTAVAARPQLGVLIFILADRRYRPTNYADLTIDDGEIAFNGNNNYTTVVSRKVHAAGGHGFVTELAGPVEPFLQRIANSAAPTPDAAAARDQLAALLGAFPYLTRLYTRLSAEDMTIDPTFASADGAADVSNLHDMTRRSGDAGTCDAPPCSFTDCGPHGRCIVVGNVSDAGIILFPASIDTCQCDDGYTAAAVQTSFVVGAAVQCEPVTNNLMPGGGTAGSCSNDTCGPGGECVAINGTPTCVCGPGYVANATAVFDGTSYVPMVRCIPVNGPIPPPPTITIDAGPLPTVTIDAGSPASVREAGTGLAPKNSTVGCACAFLGQPRASWRGVVLAGAALALAATRRRRPGRRALVKRAEQVETAG